MIPDTPHLLAAILAGIGATILIDLWALFLNSAFRIPSLSSCVLGRWLLHMLEGRFAHPNIGDAEPRRHECATGWLAHYLIGISFSLVFILLAPGDWLERPTLLPALLFGLVTVLIPFFVMQPAFGLGIAGARTAKPALVRLKSLGTHSVFGLGLYLCGALAGRIWFHS